METCFKSRFGVSRQSGLISEARGFIRLLKQFQPELSLTGLEEYTHLWVLWQFHKNPRSEEQRFHARVRPPRLEGATRGLFATRSPHRPNSLGLSLLKIVEITSFGVSVSGCDMLDGTPVFDLKPYLPEVEAPEEAQSPSSRWRDHFLGYRIQFSECSHEVIEREAARQGILGKDLRQLIEKVILQDPVPEAYKGIAPKTAEPRLHHVRLYDLDVHFTLDTRECLAQVISITET